MLLNRVRQFKLSNPILSSELELEFNIPGFKVREMINELRQEKYPIGSNRSGYYWANTYQELLPTIEDLQSRIKGIKKALDGLEKSYEPELF